MRGLLVSLFIIFPVMATAGPHLCRQALNEPFERDYVAFEARFRRLAQYVEVDSDPARFMDFADQLFKDSEKDLVVTLMYAWGDPATEPQRFNLRHAFMRTFQSEVLEDRTLLLRALRSPWARLMNLDESDVLVNAEKNGDFELVNAIHMSRVNIDYTRN